MKEREREKKRKHSVTRESDESATRLGIHKYTRCAEENDAFIERNLRRI